MGEFDNNTSRELLVLVIIDRLNDIIQTVLKINLRLKQICQEVNIWIIINHLLLRRHPSCSEVEMVLLQMELQHLEGFHQEKTDAIPSLGVSLSTRQKDASTRDSRCLDWQIVHCHCEKSGEGHLVNLGHPISNIEISLTKLPTSQNLRMLTIFDESSAVM